MGKVAGEDGSLNRQAESGRIFARLFVETAGAILLAHVIVAAAVTHFTAYSLRPLVMLAVWVVTGTAIAAWSRLSFRPRILAVGLATLLSAVIVYVWRRSIDPLAFFGAIPSSLEVVAVGISAGISVLFATAVAFAIGLKNRVARTIAASAVLLLLMVLGGILAQSAIALRTTSALAMHLRQVLQFEAEMDQLGIFERQDLSFRLAMLGRGAEALRFSTRYGRTSGQSAPQSDEPAAMQIDLRGNCVDWRPAIRDIAARERIVIIMEAHNATQHREWIQQTLPIFYEAGFRHYAAEALAETGTILKTRRYPSKSSGVYPQDPRFGNLLRHALDLGFEIDDYEAHLATDPLQREEEQAETLAGIISKDPQCKIVIHVGHAHAFKQPMPGFGEWMAARLWKKTRVEPYCIYQAYGEFDSPTYARVAESAGVVDEPRLLLVPPTDLVDPQFADIPDSAIDAIVIHPLLRGRSPRERKPAFAKDSLQIPGRWLGEDSPVIVGAYREDEPDDAIAFDQVMLRQGESVFELWVPQQPYQLRVTTLSGIIPIDVVKTQQGYELRKKVSDN